METIKNRSKTFRLDMSLYRMVVIVLATVALVCLIGTIALALSGVPAPELLGMLASASVGALAGLLTPTPKEQS